MKLFLLLLLSTFGALQASSLRIECLENNFNGTCTAKDLNVDGKSESIATVNDNGIEDIDEFHVFNQRVKYLPTNIGEKFPDLTSLRIERSGLQNIEKSSFRGMNKLQTLSLWNNDLKSLNYDTFDDLPLLLHLDLNDNNIDELDRRIFKKLTALTTLNLDSNYLKSLDVMLFRNNKNLEHLSIRKNTLKTLPITIFEKLENLKILNLDNNELEGLPDQLFKTNLQLRELTVADNNIESVGAENRDRLMNLESYNFLFNPCTKNLNQEATNEELLKILEENCKTEPPTKIKWLEAEIDELRRSKRSNEESIECAEQEFLRNDENINSTREVILNSISGLSSGTSGSDTSTMISDIASMKTDLAKVDATAEEIKRALNGDDSKMNKNFESVKTLVKSEKGMIDTKIDDKIKRVKDKIDVKVGEVLTALYKETTKLDNNRDNMRIDLLENIEKKLEAETKKLSGEPAETIHGVGTKIDGQKTELASLKTKIEKIVTSMKKLEGIETKVDNLAGKVEKVTKCNFFELSFEFIKNVIPSIDGDAKMKEFFIILDDLKSKENVEYDKDFSILMKTSPVYDNTHELSFRNLLRDNCGLTAKPAA